MRLGFHISIAGGFAQVVPRAKARGCTAFQVFTSSPSQWARKPIAAEDAAAFRQAVAEAGIDPVFVHAIYLLNLSSPNDVLRKKSIANLAEELGRAEQLGAVGVVFHLGSVGQSVHASIGASSKRTQHERIQGPFALSPTPARGAREPAETNSLDIIALSSVPAKLFVRSTGGGPVSKGERPDIIAGIKRLARSLVEVRRRARSGLPLILENSAGAGSLVGGTLAELAEVIDRASGAEPMRLCFDTAHAFGAGIAVHTREGLDAAFGHPVIRERLAVIHANDSTGEFGGHRDRHWHVGKGRIGMDAFRRVVNHPLLKDVPLIMETPGNEADDRSNMRTMIRLLGGGFKLNQ